MSSKSKKSAPAKKGATTKKSATAKKSSKAKKPSLESLQKNLVGTWRLMSAEDRNSPSDPWVNGTFGIPPSGYFIYDATGHASIQIMTTPPVKLADPTSPNSPTAAEALEIFNGYIAYYGTYTLDDKNIYHQVEGAWDPRQVGSVQTRPYELKGDQLIIGDQITYIRVLERVK
ncbi:MAG: lipocalin-like domain-containing protein [Acidobacteria bacterium]|nr:lipocalin-like domain-containing protein [Acidobacteriota bacterium]